ncbi:hypothetical protein B0H15DRAFT_796764 [Mycena belliarum]|uniref:Uncharacterized protein n=1 Tax=Mycena belliarum TaxID=1033014 RepID=A0AAD6UIH7_9AGAR|nr:hypothetical protein B0H15DRAFT_796764 [Mycena belliae]
MANQCHSCCSSCTDLLSAEKTALARAIAGLFDSLGVTDLLAVTALSSTTASAVGGQPVGCWAGLPVSSTSRLPTVTAAIKKRICSARYLVIDHISLLSHSRLVQLATRITKTRSDSGLQGAGLPFGGLNVIMLGDLHLLPPALRHWESLYREPAPGRASAKTLISSFTVTSLALPAGVQEAGWENILSRLRRGSLNTDDAEVIEARLLMHKNASLPDFHAPPWATAPLITVNENLAQVWNGAALRKLARISNSALYSVRSRDLRGNRELTDAEHRGIANLPVKQTANLPSEIYLTVGMPVLVRNPEGDLVLATVVEVRTDGAQVSNVGERIQRLQGIPVVICRVVGTGAAADFDVPVCTRAFPLDTVDGDNTRIQRTQLSMRAALALTLYEAEGMHFERFFADFGSEVYHDKQNYWQIYSALARAPSTAAFLIVRPLQGALEDRRPPSPLLSQNPTVLGT